MNCPNCHREGADKVIDSRDWCNPQLDQTGIRRRRECQLCRVRFTTLEVLAILAPDGSVLPPPELNGHTNGNGHKPTPKPKKPKRSKSQIKKQLDMALRRARVRAIKIEDEDELLGKPDLMDEPDDLDLSDIDDMDL